MPTEPLDDNTINKLIPQIFGEVRSTIDAANQQHITSIMDTSSITTHAVSIELDNLDRIIPLIERIDECMKTVLPNNMERLHEICKSTNAILDAWISVQSQAGYIHQLMDEPMYISDLKENGLDNEGGLEKELGLEIESLKRDIEKERQMRSTPVQPPTPNGVRNASRPINGGKGVASSRTVGVATSARGQVARRAGIPRSDVPTRSSKPSPPRNTRYTPSTRRKMFR